MRGGQGRAAEGHQGEKGNQYSHNINFARSSCLAGAALARKALYRKITQKPTGNCGFRVSFEQPANFVLWRRLFLLFPNAFFPLLRMVLGLIPARFASTRLPGKPLVDLGGQSMIQRVVAQARQANLARVVVATDDERIRATCSDFGGEAVLTRPDHPSGTDRLWEAFQQLGSPAEVHCIVNIQGDEPFIHPAQINALTDLFADEATAPGIATLVKPVVSEEELFSPHLPKVVLSQQGQALYFSRHPLPYQRQHASPPSGWLTTATCATWACTPISRPCWSSSPSCPYRRSKPPKAWSSCAGWKPASAFAAPKPSSTPSASTRPEDVERARRRLMRNEE